jgi:hypothetical protein
MALLELDELLFARFGCRLPRAFHADTVPRAVHVFQMSETGFGNCVEPNSLEIWHCEPTIRPLVPNVMYRTYLFLRDFCAMADAQRRRANLKTYNCIRSFQGMMGKSGFMQD